MTDSHHVPLPGSSRTDPAGVERLGPVDPSDTVTFTVFVRRRADLPGELVEGPDTVSTEELGARYGAHPDEVAQVRAVLEAAGAQVLDAHAGSRRVRASAPASVAAQLFAVELSNVRSTHPVTGEPVEHRGRTGELRVPAALDGLVTAVLGLDDRPQARSYVRGADAKKPKNASYTPPELATIYGFPADADGTGQTAAILEFGGGFTQDDLNTYFQGLGLTPPSVTAVAVDGGSNQPGGGVNSADGEVMLDIEVLGGVAPKTTQLVYFAPNTDQGFVDAITDAVHATPTPVVVSISWGQSEDAWTAQTRTAMDNAFADAAALGVTVTVAAGDSGSADSITDGQQHVDFPASSPHVLACGGTSLQASGGKATAETVWNDGANGGSTGGGVSDAFPVPAWQANVGVPNRAGGTASGRGVPDVAAVADPQTGYQVRVDGQNIVLGGTSAVAPLWAGLVCRYAQLLDAKLGLLQTAIYDAASAGHATTGFRDITSGNNGAYKAEAGWDPCTGLGVPDGGTLLNVLRDHVPGAGAHAQGWPGVG